MAPCASAIQSGRMAAGTLAAMRARGTACSTSAPVSAARWLCRPAPSSNEAAVSRSRPGSKLTSFGPGVKSAQRVAQLCVVSKRGEKPSGNFAAHRRAATGSSWA